MNNADETMDLVSFAGVGYAECKVGVNKPELLPKEFTSVIDVADFLSNGQEKRIAKEIDDLEKDTGFKLRVLAQNYPVTPGLAIKDFWQVDDNTIVFVADPTFGNIPNLVVKFFKYPNGKMIVTTGLETGNILNFNVGATVDLDIPCSFWSRLAGKYGNMFYWKEKARRLSRLKPMVATFFVFFLILNYLHYGLKPGRRCIH